MKNSVHLNTKILGLIGHPLKHSYSPFIHNIAIDLKEIDYIYLPFDIPASNLKNAVRGMIALGIRGFNVTIPHKENIIQFMSNVSEEASIIGAVNTVVNELGKLSGYNTDVNGILETLNPFKEEIFGNEISVIGAGGASRAVIYTLIRYFKPSKIFLVNRTEQRADSLKNYFQDKMKYNSFKTKELFPPDLVEVFRSSKLIVNATSVGMYPDVDDSITMLADSFTKGQIVFDLVYNPIQTNLLKLASSNGAIALDGLKMLVYQAAKSFELWTSETMPVEQVYKSLQLFLKA
ncbi:MAG TPA: shikimate dehydrogenase [Ignavibacteriaceae bacterium]|nr:shikimate dehydrogenase [Ignavibacteriaceae bacterium]